MSGCLRTNAPPDLRTLYAPPSIRHSVAQPVCNLEPPTRKISSPVASFASVSPLAKPFNPRIAVLAHNVEAALTIYCLGKEMLLTTRSEEHTSELQSLMRISYAVFCLKKKKKKIQRKKVTNH